MKRFSESFVALPDPLKASITAVVLVVFSLAFTNFVLLAPFLMFLQPYVVPIASAVALALIAWLERMIPDAYGQVAIYALELVLALVAVFTGIQVAAAQGVMPALLMP